MVPNSAFNAYSPNAQASASKSNTAPSQKVAQNAFVSAASPMSNGRTVSSHSNNDNNTPMTVSNEMLMDAYTRMDEKKSPQRQMSPHKHNLHGHQKLMGSNQFVDSMLSGPGGKTSINSDNQRMSGFSHGHQPFQRNSYM